MINKINETLNVISNYFEKSYNNWIIAFSGGKDSTLVLLLLVEFLKTTNIRDKNVTIVYCDTGVEIPIMREYTLEVLKRLSNFSKKLSLKIDVVTSEPDIDDTFFVNVIGKGYVPPSFMFRWCTDRLRTKPLQKIANKQNCVIVLGTRKNESIERDRVLKENEISEYTYKQKAYSKAIIFSPIINYSVDEIWESIELLNKDGIIDLSFLKHLYRGFVGSNEKDENSLGGRYGCWTCTVVRKDKACQNLISKGYDNLQYLLDYRELLINYKNNPENRLKNRKTLAEGKGPFKMSVRKVLLDKLLETEKLSGYELIRKDEVDRIYDIWKDDLEDC